jgi:hypothetical protein
MLFSKRDALLAIMFSSFSWPSRADVLVAPADQFFSAKFPIQPEQKTSETDGLLLNIYGSRDGGRAFAVAHALWPVEPDPALALQSIMGGLIERVAAELLSIEKIDFVSAGGKKLFAKRFTYGNSKLWSGGLTVASGRHSFVVQVTKRKPSEGFDSTDEQFISSFEVLSA